MREGGHEQRIIPSFHLSLLSSSFGGKGERGWRVAD